MQPSSGGTGREKLGVIFHLRCLTGGLRVGHEVLAEAKLPPQPPQKRLIEKQHPSQPGQKPCAKIVLIDVGPFMSEAPSQRLFIAAEVFRKDDHRSPPGRGKRLVQAAAHQESDPTSTPA
jgi:hypothetical protein